MNNHKLLSANFTDNEKTNIETIWEVPGEDIPYVSHIEAVETDLQFQDLLSNITLDEIHENTYKYIRAQREEFEAAVINIAEKEGLVESAEKVDQIEFLMNIINDDLGEDKEKLFKFKLVLFDSEEVKNSKDRNAKTELRKAKTLLEAIVAYSKFKIK